MFTLIDFLALNERPSIDYKVIETMRFSSAFLDRAMYKTIAGGAERITRRNTYPTVTPRAFNGAVAESTGTFSTMTEMLAIYPGRGTVDRAFRQMENKNDAFAQTLMDQVTAVTKRVEADIFQGVALNDMLGINARLAAQIGTPQIFAVAANGLNVGLNAANALVGFAGLDRIIRLVPGPNQEKIIVMNQRTYERYKAACRALGTMSFVNDRDLIGREFISYGGIPIVIMENDATNTLILPENEVQGTSGANCSSVYCIRWDMNEGLCVLTDEKSGGGMNFYVDMVERVPGQSSGEVFVEGYFGLRMGRDDAVARLTGLL